MAVKTDNLTWREITALVLWTFAGSLALVLVGRAIAGAFDRPVSPVIPVLVTALVLTMSLIAWTLFYAERFSVGGGRRLLDGLLAVVPAALAGFATSVNTTPVALAIVSSLLVGGLARIAAWEGIRHMRKSTSAAAKMTPQAEVNRSEEAVEFVESSPRLPSTASASPHDVPMPIEQHQSRRSHSDGSEEIEAVLIARFAAGQRRTVVHLPIQPVLSSTPTVECEPLDDASVQVRPTAVHGFGVRVEVKRTESIDFAADVPIGVFVTSRRHGESAA